MKFRDDFVTNSSSASFIIAFARIANESKAKEILDAYGKDMMSADEIRAEKYGGCYGADWAGADLYTVDDILMKNPGSKFVMFYECNDAEYEEDSYEPIYDYDFSCNSLIAVMTEENGFVDVEVSEGEGRNG